MHCGRCGEGVLVSGDHPFDEGRAVAYHEAGHGVIVLHHHLKLDQISIVPDGKSQIAVEGT